jgi:hypothetical protein
MTELNDEQRMQISEQAQTSVDFTLGLATKDGSDKLEAVIGLVAFYEEALHWALEAKARIEKERGK